MDVGTLPDDLICLADVIFSLKLASLYFHITFTDCFDLL